MITLDSVVWGSGPKIRMTFAYEKQRSGAAMQYRVNVTIAALTGTSYFGYPIYLDLALNGSTVGTTTLKNASPSQWSSAITYTSGWYTVANKTSGTTNAVFKVYSGSGSTRNTTYTYSFATDPAASKLTAPNGTLATGVSLAVTKYDTNFTHTIEYVCGTAKGKVCEKSSATTVNWATSNGNTLELARQNVSGQTVSVTFTITTYSGTTVVGTNTATNTMTIPDVTAMHPTLTLAVSDAAGYLATYGAYVQGRSKLKITATPTLAYGSPINTYYITADGQSYSSSSVTTEVLRGKGTLSVKARVRDKRSFPSEWAITDIQVLEYAKPSVNVVAYRCNSSGTADAEGAYMKVGFTASISSLNGKNSASYSITYTGLSSPITGSGTSYTSEAIAWDVAKVCSVEVTVTDKLDHTTKSGVIPMAFTLMDFYNTGKGIAFGKVATRNGFDCAMAAYFAGAVSASAGINGVYVQTAQVWGVDNFRLQSRFAEWYDTGDARQSFLVVGSANGNPVIGAIRVNSAGGAVWSGTGNLTVSKADVGVIVVTTPMVCYDHFLIMSPQAFSVL